MQACVGSIQIVCRMCVGNIQSNSILIPPFQCSHTHSTQSRFRVLPSSSHTLTYNLYPIATGMVPLPHLDLAYQRDSKAAEAIVQGSLPATIFIKVGTTPDYCSTILDNYWQKGLLL